MNQLFKIYLRIIYFRVWHQKRNLAQYKYDNLQYNTLARWVSGTNDLSPKRLMFQVFFFKNSANFKIKSFECPQPIRSYEKKNAWNIRHLVDELFVPSTLRPSRKTEVILAIPNKPT
jgi:hypothetical protein